MPARRPGRCRWQRHRARCLGGGVAGCRLVSLRGRSARCDGSLPEMSAPTDDDPTAYRLPYSVVPSRYHLTLVPDLVGATFTGDVSIDVSVAEPVTAIVLNAAELTIDSATAHPGRQRWRHRARALLDHPRCRRGTGHAHLSRSCSYRSGHPPSVVHRHPQRQAARVLPEHLHRRRRQRAADRHHPDRGNRRPSGLPLLGRAGPQGRRSR